MNSPSFFMAAYYFWLILGGVVVYMCIVDENVLEFINLFFLGVWVQLKKYYYMAKLHPFWIMNPVGKWWMMRKYRKMAEELMAKTKENNEES